MYSTAPAECSILIALFQGHPQPEHALLQVAAGAADVDAQEALARLLPEEGAAEGAVTEGDEAADDEAAAGDEEISEDAEDAEDTDGADGDGDGDL